MDDEASIIQADFRDCNIIYLELFPVDYYNYYIFWRILSDTSVYMFYYVSKLFIVVGRI